MQTPTNNKIISFVGSETGQWSIFSMETIVGPSMKVSKGLDIIEGYNNSSPEKPKPDWVLNAFKSNLRYTKREEKNSLDKESRALGQPEYNCAALIPIKKSDEWWLLTQDERRKIFEEDSRHIGISMKYLPFISRQLHHCRDLGEQFDFLTWFEFSSQHNEQFNDLCDALRKTEEWKYIVRETDIRLTRM